MKHSLAVVVAVALLCGMATSACAASKVLTLNWLNPTVDVDGLAIDATDITGYVLQYAKNATMTGASTKVIPAVTADPDGDGDILQTAQLTLNQSGRWYITIYAVDIYDRNGLEWAPYLEEKVTGKPGKVRVFTKVSVEVVVE